MSIGFGCREGWLHVNADWVLLEPVDRDYAPTPPGEPSHTVLLSNLANHVQPIIRYDLGDSVIANRSLALAVIRCRRYGSKVGAMTCFRCVARMDVVRLLPLALTTIVEEATHVHRFQIVQTGADRLTLRFGPCADDVEMRSGMRPQRRYGSIWTNNRCITST